ncbi:hypothetical protein V8E54_008005 [Elaphomyces granulatus]
MSIKGKHRKIGCKDELGALDLLGKNRSKHSLSLVRVPDAKEGDDGMVPNTGFATYILMTWCPGVPLLEKDYYFKPKTEREAIRHAFKEAWDDARRCGVFNRLPIEGGLIWDVPNKKCYMVDFKDWSPPRPADRNYILPCFLKGMSNGFSLRLRLRVVVFFK